MLPKHTDELVLTPESEDFSLEVHEFGLVAAAAAAEALAVSPPKCWRSSADLDAFLLYSGDDKAASVPLLAEKRGLGVGFDLATSAPGTIGH